jgi:uncharacterized protein (DUF1501 family)
MSMDRRQFVRGMCLGGLATAAGALVTFAQTRASGRFVFVLLRGGLDGLAALVPVGDPAYPVARGGMAYAPDVLVPLDGTFALAPGLAPLRTLWEAGALAPVHALAIPYRTRSHFDGQAVLETGLDRPVGSSDGWLNRLLQVMDGERAGIAVAAGMPRSLAGSFPALSWSPIELGVVDDDYVERLHVLYARDPMLHDRFEAALRLGELGGDGMSGGQRGAGAVEPLLRATARFLREPDGPNVAALEFSGWDTHAGQGLAGGPLDRQLGRLAAGLAAFRDELEADWAGTTMVVMTEFGRTVRPNGTGGTDHGTAGAAFVLGAGVAGGRVHGDWPGLGARSLYEDRDVRPTLDTRAVLKGALAGTFDLTAAQLARVFPDSDRARPLADLMR